jgi:hemoglobin
MTQLKELYAKYRPKMPTGVADELYILLKDDPEFAAYFRNIDTMFLADHLHDIISELTGGPDLYEGRDLKAVHAKLKIPGATFDRFLEIFMTCLLEYGFEQDDAALVLGAVRGQRDNVVTA